MLPALDRQYEAVIPIIGSSPPTEECWNERLYAVRDLEEEQQTLRQHLKMAHRGRA